MNEKFSCTRYRLKWINREEVGSILLEVLLALSLTGILMILISPSLFNVSRFLFRASDTAEHSRIQRLLYRKMADTLDNAYWYPYFDGQFPGFFGDERGFMVLAVREGGLGQAEFRLNGGELVFKWSGWQRQNTRSEAKGSGETVLLTGQLVNPSFFYLDEKSGVWRSVWEEEYYPRLVRFNSGYQYRSGQEITFVPLVFPIRIGQEDGR